MRERGNREIYREERMRRKVSSFQTSTYIYKYVVHTHIHVHACSSLSHTHGFYVAVAAASAVSLSPSIFFSRWTTAAVASRQQLRAALRHYRRRRRRPLRRPRGATREGRRWREYHFSVFVLMPCSFAFRRRCSSSCPQCSSAVDEHTQSFCVCSLRVFQSVAGDWKR